MQLLKLAHEDISILDAELALQLLALLLQEGLPMLKEKVIESKWTMFGEVGGKENAHEKLEAYKMQPWDLELTVCLLKCAIEFAEDAGDGFVGNIQRWAEEKGMQPSKPYGLFVSQFQVLEALGWKTGQQTILGFLYDTRFLQHEDQQFLSALECAIFAVYTPWFEKKDPIHDDEVVVPLEYLYYVSPCAIVLKHWMHVYKQLSQTVGPCLRMTKQTMCVMPSHLEWHDFLCLTMHVRPGQGPGAQGSCRGLLLCCQEARLRVQGKRLEQHSGGEQDSSLLGRAGLQGAQGERLHGVACLQAHSTEGFHRHEVPP